MDKPTDEWITLHSFIRPTSPPKKEKQKQKQKQTNESTNPNEMEDGLMF